MPLLILIYSMLLTDRTFVQRIPLNCCSRSIVLPVVSSLLDKNNALEWDSNNHNDYRMGPYVANRKTMEMSIQSGKVKSEVEREARFERPGVE